MGIFFSFLLANLGARFERQIFNGLWHTLEQLVYHDETVRIRRRFVHREFPARENDPLGDPAIRRAVEKVAAPPGVSRFLGLTLRRLSCELVVIKNVFYPSLYFLTKQYIGVGGGEYILLPTPGVLPRRLCVALRSAVLLPQK